MTVRPYIYPSQGEQVVYGALTSTGGYWWGASNITPQGVPSLNNCLVSQGPANRLVNARLDVATASLEETGNGVEAMTITEAQPITVGFGRCTGSIPVIVNGMTIWLEVGSASSGPAIASGVLDDIGAAYS